MDPAFWKDKRVLITGHEGFLGSNLTRTLIAAGARVTGLDVKTHRKQTIFTADDYGRMTSVRGTVENFKLVSRLLEEQDIEYVFHLGARALVGDCLKDPVKGFSVNIKGTWQVLEAVRRRSRIKAVVVASTDKAYGVHEDLPYVEDAPLKADAPYDVSKSCADMLAYTYYKTYNVPVSVTRCGNIYGPGDFNFSRIIPDAVRCVVHNKTLKIRSDGTFVRDYVYVDDIVAAYLTLAEQMGRREVCGQAFNFSDGKPLSVLDLIKHIYAVMGVEGRYKVCNTARCEIPAQYLDASKAKKLLGWTAANTIEQGLRKAIAWYREVV